MNYSDVSLFIDGSWSGAGGSSAIDILNPATGDRIGKVENATHADLDKALAAADRAFKSWSKVPAFERYKIMRKSADMLRSRVESIAELMTLEQGQPLAQSRLETLNGAGMIDWYAGGGPR